LNPRRKLPVQSGGRRNKINGKVKRSLNPDRLKEVSRERQEPRSAHKRKTPGEKYD